MDQNTKSKWVADLRSGKYEQCEGKLKDGDSYCCLGVLCHISSPFVDFETESGYTYVHNVIDNNAIVQNLIDMNDGVDNYKGNRQNFNQIADYIERNL